MAPTAGGLCCPLTRHPLSPLRGCTENKGLSFSPGPSSLISLIVQTVLPLCEQPQVGKERFLPLLLGDLCLARDYISAAEFKCLISVDGVLVVSSGGYSFLEASGTMSSSPPACLDHTPRHLAARDPSHGSSLEAGVDSDKLVQNLERFIIRGKWLQ